ncbi:PQQ-dependent sugar dehydrogenase [Flavobacterium silvaticum]|uniref:Sorbosone dehydrogenase family protein n=1 Tax=Flavobacterium silvaticum TaxID=1852020 RepID=A0A972JG92_9FLAO|nr:sorbosone dehydrogenase family protein [Flavobacterium silvaticum]NMH27956.1 sorbosone dehydrogenase family protein [Flavobacterium silvaticum]
MKTHKIYFSIFLLSSVAIAQSDVKLPEPYATKSVKNFSSVIGWKADEKPIAPKGFTVTKFADGLENPRWIYVAPNGDIFVAESGTRIPKQKRSDEKDEFFKSKAQNFGSANRITLFRDKDKDGVYETKSWYLSGLNQPFGMLILNNYFYVANTDELLRFPYNPTETENKSKPEKLLDLPSGGYNNHWTRNIISKPDGSKIYITVGSESNVAERPEGIKSEFERANILEINPDGTGKRIFASGLRNPNGMDWAPETNMLWTAVNERDELGDDLVPDYVTSVQDGGFYGWPYSYYGQHEDPRRKGERPDLVAKAIVPDVAVGSHTASLGIAFYKADAFPEKYKNGLFVGQHGSWNRADLSGYKVLFIPFKNGKPAGKPEDFLTGFVADASKSKVHGRPTDVKVLPNGDLLVTDDAAKTIWRVSADK